jgi:short-subunit dehydrogenase
MKKTALVTGASAGIGKAFAEVFAQNSFDLVITARREERLVALQKALKQDYDVEVWAFPADLHDPAAPQQLYDRIQSKGLSIDALVNNAGYGVVGLYHETGWKTQADFIQVMITAMAQFCHVFLPGMLERGYGRIINVSSISGILPASPGYALYGGAKTFVTNLSQTLYLETEGTNVNVTALCPGFTHSEFHDVPEMQEEIHKYPSYMWMDAETVARQGFDAVMKGKPICVNGVVNRFICLLTKWLPNKRVLKMVANTTPIKPKKNHQTVT